jgi:ATP-dependent helicase HrpA
MTDGILLAETQGDSWLEQYDTLIIDEAHERSLNIDFLLGYLKQLLPKRRRDLKLIITSATIDAQRFSRHFDDAPVIEVSGRLHPVELRYRPLQKDDGNEAGGAASGRSERGDDQRDLCEAIVDACNELDRAGPGDVLVFLPGEREIREAAEALRKHHPPHTEILPLFARLSAEEQGRIFKPHVGRRIVLATNVAETSLTVPGIRYVVDSGLARIKRYSYRNKVEQLQIEKIAQASANQRAGRCGRVAAGVCIRLYEEQDFALRPEYSEPEILRSSLAGVILRMKALRLGDIEDFPFLEAPPRKAIGDGYQLLLELGAVTADNALTATGQELAGMPLDPRLGRMIVAARDEGCLREVLVIAAALSVQDPRERPQDRQGSADTAHQKFADPKSEFLSWLKLWDWYQAEVEHRKSQRKLVQTCHDNFLSALRMREWRDNSLATPADYVVLHKAILCGLPAQIGRKNEKQQFEAPRQRRFQLFPGSALARKPPLWVVSAVVMETQKVYGLINAAIEPDWVIDVAAHLLTRRHHDPHWSRSQGRVIASEQISLHGLVLAPKRPISYANIDFAHARQIFIREGLVTGEVNLRIPLLERNQRILQRALEEEAKLRRVGIVIDEEAQAEWYAKRLPDDVASAPELESWYKRLSLEQRGALEWRVDDLLPQDTRDAAQFPSMFRLGEVSLRLSYRFEPGASDDGVTLHVPLHLLNALDARALDWLVPGLLEDRVAELLRGLPKVLRRNFVPVPDFARAFLAAVTPGAPGQARDQLQTSLAVFLRKTTGVEVPVDAWDDASVPAHLRFNLRLSEGRNVLEESRDLAHLKTRWGDRAQTAFAAEAGKRLEGQVIEQFPADGVPEQIAGVAGVPAFPALAAQASEVVLRVFADREAARVEHPLGVRALLLRAVADRIKQARKQLPISPRTGLLYASVESSERLREDLVEAALNAICADHLVGIRSRQAFDGLAQRIGRELFAEATRRPAVNREYRGGLRRTGAAARSALDGICHRQLRRPAAATGGSGTSRFLARHTL